MSTVDPGSKRVNTMASQLKAPQRAVAVTANVALRHVLGLDLKLSGVSRLPKDAHIVAHNLVSPLDAFIVALALQESGHSAPVIMLDYELARVPLLSWLMTSGALAVDKRVGPEGHDDPFGIATRALWEGRCVITAPEQVVSPSFEILPVRTGPIRLAGATNASLVPTAIFGAHRLFDAGGKMRLRRRGASVGVTFGSPTTPPESPDEFTMARRMLQFDLEALLSQTLDDYTDREEGEAGAVWWPATRGGSAPSLLETLEDIDAPTPTIELWADDRTVNDTRRALMSSTVQTAPTVATWVLDDDDDDDGVDAATSAAGSTPAAEPEPPRPALPTLVPLDASEPVLNIVHGPPVVASAVPRSIGVDGMLAFDLPGMPRKVLRQTRLESQGNGQLAVFIGDTALLDDVKVDRRPDKTLFTGTLRDAYRVSSGDLTIDVPAGTQATLVAMRSSSASADAATGATGSGT